MIWFHRFTIFNLLNIFHLWPFIFHFDPFIFIFDLLILFWLFIYFCFWPLFIFCFWPFIFLLLTLNSTTADQFNAEVVYMEGRRLGLTRRQHGLFAFKIAELKWIRSPGTKNRRFSIFMAKNRRIRWLRSHLVKNGDLNDRLRHIYKAACWLSIIHALVLY